MKTKNRDLHAKLFPRFEQVTWNKPYLRLLCVGFPIIMKIKLCILQGGNNLKSRDFKGSFISTNELFHIPCKFTA